MIDRFCQSLIATLSAKIHEKTEYLASGKCTSMEDYRRVAGEIAGLRLAQDAVREVRKTYDQDNED
jgi:hypothetical protein